MVQIKKEIVIFLVGITALYFFVNYICDSRNIDTINLPSRCPYLKLMPQEEYVWLIKNKWKNLPYLQAYLNEKENRKQCYYASEERIRKLNVNYQEEVQYLREVEGERDAFYQKTIEQNHQIFMLELNVNRLNHEIQKLKEVAQDWENIARYTFEIYKNETQDLSTSIEFWEIQHEQDEEFIAELQAEIEELRSGELDVEPDLEVDVETDGETNVEDDGDADVEIDGEADVDPHVEPEDDLNVDTDGESGVEADVKSDDEADDEAEVETDSEAHGETDVEGDVAADGETNVEDDGEADVATDDETNGEVSDDTDVETDVEAGIEDDIETDVEPNNEANVEPDSEASGPY